METHQVVNPKLVVFPGCFRFSGAEWAWAIGRMRQVKRPRSWRTGVTLRQVPLQPTLSSQHNRSESRKQGCGRHVPAPKGEGRRATDTSQREGPQTRRLEGTGLDLRGHQLCGARNSQGTDPRTGGHSKLKRPLTEVFGPGSLSVP